MQMNKLYGAIVVIMGSQPAWAAESVQQVGTLSPIVITASLSAQKASDAPASMTVVTAADIQNSTATSLAEMLGKTVGVQNYNGGGRDKLVIRGVRESYGVYTLILVNGKRVSSTGALWRDSDFDISSIPLESIERVEVIRGPMSSLYGSDAIGGVINIITKKPTSDWHGSASATYSMVDRGYGKDQYRIGASATGALTDTLGLSIAAEQYDRDPWFSQGRAVTPAYYWEGKKTQNLRSTLSWDLAANQSIDLDLGYNKDERPYGMDTYAYYPAYNFTSIAFSSQEIERHTVGITHHGDWDWGKTTVLANQENSEIHDYDSEFDAPQNRLLKEKNTNIKAYTNVELGLNAIVLGAEYNNQEVEDQVTYENSGKGEVTTTSLFFQDDFQILDPLTLTFGGRFDDHEVFGDHFSPKAYLVYKLTDDITVKGGFGKAFKAPSLAQLNRNYVIISCGGGQFGCDLRGNPDLKPETSTNYEASIAIDKPVWNASATVFRNEIKDMIGRETGNIGTVNSYAKWINFTNVKINGVELQGGLDINPELSLSANATYLDAKDQNDKRLEERPQTSGNFAINWQVIDMLALTAGADYVGKQVYGGKDLPDYTLVNLGATTQLDTALKLKFGVRNLTDVDLQEKSEKANVQFNTKELGRNYYVGLTYSF